MKSVLMLHAYLHHTSHDSVLHDADSIPQTPGKGVHGCDVSDEQVLHVRRLPAHLSVEVQPPRLQAALLDDGLLQRRPSHTVLSSEARPQFLVSAYLHD